MDDVDKLYRQHRQQVIDGFVIAMLSMVGVGLMSRFLHVDLLQMGIGVITGNVGTNAVNAIANRSILNSPNNAIGSPSNPLTSPTNNATAPTPPPQPPTGGHP